jgi:hypothetical protein
MACTLIPTHLYGAQIAAQVIGSNTTTAGNGFGANPQTREIILETICASRTDGTFTPQIDGSMDGTNWINLKQGTAITANGRNFTSWVIEKDGALPPFLRISILSASVTTGATLTGTVKIG